MCRCESGFIVSGLLALLAAAASATAEMSRDKVECRSTASVGNVEPVPSAFFGSAFFFEELIARVGEAGVPSTAWEHVFQTLVAALTRDRTFQLSDPTDEEYTATYRGRWTVEQFLRDYVFGKYHEELKGFPEELARLQNVRDPSLFDTSIRFTDFRKGWNFRYSAARLANVHDPILRFKMSQGKSAEKPLLLFTSGSMGVGKGFTLSALIGSGIVDSRQFLIVDPDELKNKIPEFAAFRRIDPIRAATFVHAESGHIQEALVDSALRLGKSLIVDGTLHAYDWWKVEIPRIRQSFPQYRTGILSVGTDLETQRARIALRAVSEGRNVEEAIWRRNRELVDKAVAKLRDLVDFQITVENHARPLVTGVYSHGETKKLNFFPPLPDEIAFPNSDSTSEEKKWLQSLLRGSGPECEELAIPANAA